MNPEFTMAPIRKEVYPILDAMSALVGAYTSDYLVALIKDEFDKLPKERQNEVLVLSRKSKTSRTHVRRNVRQQNKTGGFEDEK